MSNPVTVAIADDHGVVRQGLRAVLGADPGLTVVGEAADGLEAVNLVERLKPDVLVVDLMMPGLNGLDVTREVCRRSPLTRVVILSMYDDEAHVVEALRVGATGYCVKDASAANLVQAVREGAEGRRYLSGPLSEGAIDALLQRTQAAPLDPYEMLTSREREVLHLVAEGHTSAGIAARLSISPRTVESHRANLMRKLGLRTQADLVRYAVGRGLLPTASFPRGAPEAER